jgi:hypothetical protein
MLAPDSTVVCSRFGASSLVCIDRCIDFVSTSALHFHGVAGRFLDLSRAHDRHEDRCMTRLIPLGRGSEAMSAQARPFSDQALPHLDADDIDRRLNGLIEASRALAAAVDRFTSLVGRGLDESNLA